MKIDLKNTQAFTLMEMLITISIAVLLLGVTLSAGFYAWETARRTEAKATLVTIKAALLHYRTEYGQWPELLIQSTNAQGDIAIGWGSGESLWGDVYTCLSGFANTPDGYVVRGTTNNVRKITFLELPTRTLSNSNQPKEKDSLTAEVLDPWQTPYRMIIDGNQDGKITLPSPFNEEILTSLAIWSEGDGRPIVSWK